MEATALDPNQWPEHYPFRTALQQAEAARLGMSFESYSRHSPPEIFELLRALDRREAQPERQEAQARAKGAAPNIGRELQEQFAQEQAELAGKGQKGFRPSGGWTLMRSDRTIRSGGQTAWSTTSPSTTAERMNASRRSRCAFGSRRNRSRPNL